MWQYLIADIEVDQAAENKLPNDMVSSIIQWNMNLMICLHDMLLIAFGAEIVVFDCPLPWSQNTLSVCKRIKLNGSITRLCRQEGFERGVLATCDNDVALVIIDKVDYIMYLPTGDSAWGVAGSSNFIAASSNDWIVRVWTKDSIIPCRQFTGHNHNVPSVEIRNELVLSSSIDQTVKIWNCSSGALMASFSGSGWAWSAKFIEIGEISRLKSKFVDLIIRNHGKEHPTPIEMAQTTYNDLVELFDDLDNNDDGEYEGFHLALGDNIYSSTWEINENDYDWMYDNESAGIDVYNRDVNSNSSNDADSNAASLNTDWPEAPNEWDFEREESEKSSGVNSILSSSNDFSSLEESAEDKCDVECAKYWDEKAVGHFFISLCTNSDFYLLKPVSLLSQVDQLETDQIGLEPIVHFPSILHKTISPDQRVLLANPTINWSMDRYFLSLWVKELSVLIMANQAGFISVVRLYMDDHQQISSAILTFPSAQQHPITPIAGVTVSPIFEEKNVLILYILRLNGVLEKYILRPRILAVQ